MKALSSAQTLAVAVVGALVFVAGSLSPLGGLLDGAQTGDIPLYREYGAELLDGEIPYRDFFVEYPPGALPVFLVPAVAEGSDSALAFKALMTGLGIVALALVAFGLRAANASPSRIVLAVVLVAIAPIALGPVLLTRYDLWPATLMVAALAAVVGGLPRLGLALLGVAVAAKVYPIVAVPIVLAHIARRSGRDAAIHAAAWGAAAFAACVVPFLALGPGGLRYSAWFQFARPLHIESLGGGLLVLADRVGAFRITRELSFNSENVAGSLADALAQVSTVLQWIAVLAAWWLFARSSRDIPHLLSATAVAVCGLVAFGKVLSPQFLVWLVPLVALLPQRAFVASILLVAALVLTRFTDYWDGIADSPAGWVVVARNLVLVGLLGLLVAVERRHIARRRPVRTL